LRQHLGRPSSGRPFYFHCSAARRVLLHRLPRMPRLLSSPIERHSLFVIAWFKGAVSRCDRLSFRLCVRGPLDPVLRHFIQAASITPKYEIFPYATMSCLWENSRTRPSALFLQSAHLRRMRSPPRHLDADAAAVSRQAQETTSTRRPRLVIVSHSNRIHHAFDRTIADPSARFAVPDPGHDLKSHGTRDSNARCDCGRRVPSPPERPCGKLRPFVYAGAFLEIF
jgi:hypothetical protein